MLPQLMGKCKGEEESWGKEKSEDSVRRDYNQEPVQEGEIGVIMEKMLAYGSMALKKLTKLRLLGEV